MLGGHFGESAAVACAVATLHFAATARRFAALKPSFVPRPEWGIAVTRLRWWEPPLVVLMHASGPSRGSHAPHRSENGCEVQYSGLSFNLHARCNRFVACRGRLLTASIAALLVFGSPQETARECGSCLLVSVCWFMQQRLCSTQRFCLSTNHNQPPDSKS